MGFSKIQKYRKDDKLYSYLPESRRFNLIEFEAFCIAGKRCNVSLQRILDDFKNYLKYREIPFYLKDSARPLITKNSEIFYSN